LKPNFQPPFERIRDPQTTLTGQILRELTMESRMNQPGPSIFDLSPSEKLQLVEDLWDDLAGSPEAVPVHDWQKQELARRKANLLRDPSSAISWEDVKQRVRARYGR
jgi:putative addiction module component (TIGR02574 family)